jgi:hypothetical protein
MGVKVAGAKPLSARQRLLIRIDQAKAAIATAERALGSGKERDALRELTFARACVTGACTELEHIAAKQLDPDPHTPRGTEPLHDGH